MSKAKIIGDESEIGSFKDSENAIITANAKSHRDQYHQESSLSVVARAWLRAATAIPADQYHESFGDVLWWRMPVSESPWIGSPLSGDWDFVRGYYTHWTPLVVPVVSSMEFEKTMEKCPNPECENGQTEESDDLWRHRFMTCEICMGVGLVKKTC